MGSPDLSGSEKLKFPDIRNELLIYLDELSAIDLKEVWQHDLENGLVSGMSQIIHFFFDDNEFDESDIGWSLQNDAEVEKVARVKGALDALIQALPKGRDDDYIAHPLWPQLQCEAKEASRHLRATSPKTP